MPDRHPRDILDERVPGHQTLRRGRAPVCLAERELPALLAGGARSVVPARLPRCEVDAARRDGRRVCTFWLAHRLDRRRAGEGVSQDDHAGEHIRVLERARAEGRRGRT